MSILSNEINLKFTRLIKPSCFKFQIETQLITEEMSYDIKYLLSILVCIALHRLKTQM